MSDGQTITRISEEMQTWDTELLLWAYANSDVLGLIVTGNLSARGLDSNGEWIGFKEKEEA